MAPSSPLHSFLSFPLELSSGLSSLFSSTISHLYAPRSTSFEHLDHFLALSKPHTVIQTRNHTHEPAAAETGPKDTMSAAVIATPLSGSPNECHASTPKAFSEDENANTLAEFVANGSKVSCCASLFLLSPRRGCMEAGRCSLWFAPSFILNCPYLSPSVLFNAPHDIIVFFSCIIHSMFQ